MYQSAIFFDNELQNVSNVKRVCGPITSVQIDETPNLTLIPWTKLTDFTSRLGSNAYYNVMKSLYKGEAYDERSGMGGDAIAAYFEWEQSSRNMGARACIVDWDRTLTKVEGFTPPSRISMNQMIYTGHDNVPIEDFLLYMCGSKERYMMLKLLFRTCIHDKVDIIVLTNNGAAADPKLVPMFQTIVDYFTGTSTQIIAASTFQYHKGLALQSTSGFNQLCGIVPQGGKWCRKNRKTRKRK